MIKKNSNVEDSIRRALDLFVGKELSDMDEALENISEEIVPFVYETEDTYFESTDAELALVVLKQIKKKAANDYDDDIEELEELIEAEDEELEIKE